MTILYKPPTTIEIIFICSMMLNPYVAQPIKKRKQKIKSYVTMVIRYMWYVFEFRFK